MKNKKYYFFGCLFLVVLAIAYWGYHFQIQKNQNRFPASRGEIHKEVGERLYFLLHDFGPTNKIEIIIKKESTS